MARDGYRIFDSDTHVGPDAASSRPISAQPRGTRLAGWAEYESRDRHGKITYTKGQRRYRRRLGEAEPDDRAGRLYGGIYRRQARRASPRRRSMPIPPRASPTWISRAST